jgi:hypothetical protein
VANGAGPGQRTAVRPEGRQVGEQDVEVAPRHRVRGSPAPVLVLVRVEAARLEVEREQLESRFTLGIADP